MTVRAGSLRLTARAFCFLGRGGLRAEMGSGALSGFDEGVAARFGWVGPTWWDSRLRGSRE